ncbi:hypothetical protein NIES22_13280 [Calothrix brevissima NIES-22]|nr:hypothetical protein NIES22_13280 [Calothrix brevissima NIES-22]
MGEGRQGGQGGQGGQGRYKSCKSGDQEKISLQSQQSTVIYQLSSLPSYIYLVR